uniref:Uncharacterized protein n=1 Tax=Arundo donax TaxID=35708 RepID=A0A0A8Y6T6_ARUDO
MLFHESLPLTHSIGDRCGSVISCFDRWGLDPIPLSC